MKRFAGVCGCLRCSLLSACFYSIKKIHDLRRFAEVSPHTPHWEAVPSALPYGRAGVMPPKENADDV